MTTLYFPRCRETGASVYGAPRVPVDSRYVGAAALERAILDAAALAPEFPPHPVRTFPDGAYSLPPMQWSDGADGMPAGYRAAHGPVMPEPPAPERIRVEFHYLTGDGTRGFLTADNLAPGLVSLAAKVRRAAAAWDGKVRRAPRPKAAPASAPHAAARALWAEGSFADALALAANVGAVFFGAASPGHDPMAYMQARPADVADVGATIARSIVSGKFRVLHTASGLAIDDAKHGAPTGGFSSFSAALDWLEERAADADWMAKLQRAAAKAPTWDQAAGAAHYAPADSDPAGNMPGAAPESTHAAANDATGPDAPDPAPDAPAGSIAAESAPVADAVSRAARDIVAEFYDSQLRGAPGETVPADAIEARAQWLRGTAAGFADLPNPERGAPYAEAAQMLERDAAAKRDAQRAAIAQTPGHAFAGPPGADSGPVRAGVLPARGASVSAPRSEHPEMAALVADGLRRVSVAQFCAEFAALGYRVDRSADCRHVGRWLTGPRAGQSFPACSTGIREADTGRSAFHFEARRDANFRAMQALRGEVFAVLGDGSILQA